MDGERREAGLAPVIDARADRAQRVDEIADRPLVHARHAGDDVLAFGKRERRGERPQRRARIAEEEIGFFFAKGAACAMDGQRFRALGDRHTETLQRLAHDARVLGVEKPAGLRLARGERGEQQHAVREALGARQAHGTARPARGFQLEDVSHRSRALRAAANKRSSAAPSPAASSRSMSPSFAR